MKNSKSFLQNLNSADITVVGFYLFLSFLNIIFCSRVNEWFYLIIINACIITFIFISARQSKKKSSVIWKYLHRWYIAPLILLTFKELYLMIKPIRQRDFDDLLIQIDRFIFGFDPTVELYKISHPVLTEVLQIVYVSFYFLPIILGIELILQKRLTEFDFSLFLIVYGFFLSYIGYFLLPAVGPRFTLHDFYSIESELPGIYLTKYLRDFVNLGESITSTMPDAISKVQRDVFPSGHTQMTLLTMYLGVIYRARVRNFLLITGALLIFSTVYLRYHYVIDILAGGAFMILSIYSGRRLYNRWNKFTSANS